MRMSEQSRVTNQVRYMNSASERMDTVQRQLSTNRRIQRASDDPAGAALAMQHRKNIAFEAQMRRNLESGTAFLNVTESALDGATELLQRARELTVQGANGTLGPNEKANVATEMNQIIQQLAQVANTNFGGAYIFSGHQTQTPAYAVAGNPPSAITWQGDNGQRIRQHRKRLFLHPVGFIHRLRGRHHRIGVEIRPGFQGPVQPLDHLNTLRSPFAGLQLTVADGLGAFCQEYRGFHD